MTIVLLAPPYNGRFVLRSNAAFTPTGMVHHSVLPIPDGHDIAALRTRIGSS